MSAGTLPNYIEDRWEPASAAESLEVLNPATGETLARVALSGKAEVGRAVEAAARAFPGWRRTPPEERVQPLFKLKGLLEAHREEVCRILSMENGKTLAEARGELKRGIESIEVACGIPTLLQGYNLEDAGRGIDEIMIRQPLGVVAAITPFNFPAMIPLWFLPAAIACGNTFILKPSERVPLTMARIFELIAELELPPGVVNLVHGSRQTVEALVDHPLVRAVSLVGSTPAARQVYARAGAAGKRAQCQGGAKNHVVIMPDADLEHAAQMVSESAFGCAGQRCLAASVVVAVGGIERKFAEAVSDLARSIRVGCGLEEGVTMGPVISRESRARVESSIESGARQGGSILLDGRGTKVPGYERGNFIRPTLIEGVSPDGELARSEIFGPVLSLIPAREVEEAIEILDRSPYGNAASIFTRSGAAARRFRYQAQAGNIGINVGVAAPMSFFPFSGWKESFFGALHGQGRDAVEFYTEKKVVIERW
jgi:malonate-semialdehyde dehydrogenase (acetylating)/methylmalonate-semialdehyde dehydrogenase